MRERLRTSSWICSASLLLLAGQGRAADWPFWRGPSQDGSTVEKAPVRSWSLDAENLLWKNANGGRSTPVIMDGRVFAVGHVGKGVSSMECAFAVDLETGRTLWEHRFNVFHTDIVENRVGWPSPVGDPETGNVYVHGTGGELICFSRDGEVLWNVSMTEELGRISGYGGRLHTPIVDEDRVIVSFLNSSWGDHARPLHRYAAFDKRTGALLWWAAPGGRPLDTTYASPVVAVIDGVRQLIAPNADGNVYGMLARTGERLWTFRLSKRGLNCSAAVNGKYAYFGHSEENIDNTEMGRFVCVDASKRGDITQTGEVWRFASRTIGYASPAIANGRVYVVDNSANLYALDAKTGELHWEFSLGRVGKGSPVVTTDGVIYVGEQNGVFHILRDAGDACVSLDKHEFDRKDNLINEIFGSPAVADGRVVFMTRYGTYCLGAEQQPDTPGAPSTLAAETSATGDTALLQVRPGEVTLAPGDAVKFTVHRYDAKGRLLGTARIPLTPVEINGRMASDGTFTAGLGAPFDAGYVVARAEGKEGRARVRIVSDLPIFEDFESWEPGSVPAGWIGVRGKTRVVERDGGRVLKKLASKEKPSPPFMRLRAYVTPPQRYGYAVQADMLSEIKKKRRRSYLPEMGLINARYRFIMMRSEEDTDQTILRIESWSPVPRFRHDVKFGWKPDTWYTARFEVQPESGGAECRAKVWPRGAEEPAEWHIQAHDPHPNLRGSAGLYCYSIGTTPGGDGPATFFDNFKVMRND